MENLDAIMVKLAAQERLDKKHNDHKLIGNDSVKSDLVREIS